MKGASRRADVVSIHADRRSLPIQRDRRAIGPVAESAEIADRTQLATLVCQAQKLETIGQRLGGIAHDFNNLLTVINIYNELLTNTLGSNSAAQLLLREMKEAAARSASLTRQLLELGEEQPPLAPTALCLNAVVRNAERLLRRLIGEDVQLETALDPLLATIEAEPEQLERVLLNLVVNARRAISQGGRIAIESKNVTIAPASQHAQPSLPAGRYVSLSVSDTGSGMPPEVKRRIFEPHFTTKGPGRGNGLGLTIVQGIVKQLKGHIEVESEPGCGARFAIYLPATQEPPP
jgi:signal transduction histidine kinase